MSKRDTKKRATVKEDVVVEDIQSTEEQGAETEEVLEAVVEESTEEAESVEATVEEADDVVEEEAEEAASEKVVDKVEENYQNQYIRLSAEFDNYRKRTTREKLDLIKSAGKPILADLLPILDDLGRASQSADVEDKALTEGLSLIENKFNEFFNRHGVKPMDSVGTAFDTDHHEALVKIPAPTEDLKGKVVEVIEKGYYLNDKVLRFAKVVVGE